MVLLAAGKSRQQQQTVRSGYSICCCLWLPPLCCCCCCCCYGLLICRRLLLIDWSQLGRCLLMVTILTCRNSNHSKPLGGGGIPHRIHKQVRILTNGTSSKKDYSSTKICRLFTCTISTRLARIRWRITVVRRFRTTLSHASRCRSGATLPAVRRRPGSNSTYGVDKRHTERNRPFFLRGEQQNGTVNFEPYLSDCAAKSKSGWPHMATATT
jgi:hypothetical protein